MPVVRLIVALLVLTCALPAAALPPNEPQAVEKDMMAFRDSMRDALKARDSVRLKTMFADGFSHIDARGVITDRDAHVTELLTGKAVIEDAGVGEWRLRQHGRDTAVLTGRSTLQPRDGADHEVRWTQIFVRELGVWRIAASQVTRLP